MDLKVSTRQEADRSILSATGEVDVFTAPTLDEAISAELAEQRVRLVVDLTKVSFLDSTGLGVLVKGLKGARDAGGSLDLVVTSERIRRIFDITGLDASLHIYDTVDAALTG
jgi:anti-sigma B factor antagonist